MKRCARSTMNEAELTPLGSASRNILPRVPAVMLGVQEADLVSRRAGGGDPARCAGTQTVGGRWTDQTVEPPGPVGLTHGGMTPECWLDLLGGGWWHLQSWEIGAPRDKPGGDLPVGRRGLAATWGGHVTRRAEVTQRSRWVEEGPQLRDNVESMAGGEVSRDEAPCLCPVGPTIGPHPERWLGRSPGGPDCRASPARSEWP